MADICVTDRSGEYFCSLRVNGDSDIDSDIVDGKKCRYYIVELLYNVDSR